MKSLKRNYLSFVDFLVYRVLKVKPPVVPTGYSQHGYHYHEGDVLPPEEGLSRDLAISGYQLLGAFTPFYKMGKDVVNTFKPYPHGQKATRDLLMGWSGHDNIGKGIRNLIGGVATLAAWLIASPVALVGCFLPTKHKHTCRSFFTKYLSYPVSWIIEGAGNLLRIDTRIDDTAALGIKMPMRAILNGVATYQGKKFLAEEKSSIQGLAEKTYQELDHIKQDCPTQLTKKGMQGELKKIQQDFVNTQSLCSGVPYLPAQEAMATVNKFLESIIIAKLISWEKIHESILTSKKNVEIIIKNLKITMTITYKYTEKDKQRDQFRLEHNQQIILLLDQLEKIITNKINQKNETIAMNEKNRQTRQNVAVMLYAIHHQYTKSVDKGWDSEISYINERNAFKNSYQTINNQADAQPINLDSTKQYLNFFRKKETKNQTQAEVERTDNKQTYGLI